MLAWWRHLSHIAKLAGIVGAITGAIVGTVAAWPIVEWVFPAHRGLLYEKIGGVQATTNELLIWKFEDGKARTKSEIDGWSIQMQKEQDPQTRSLIQRRIEQLNTDQSQIDDRIRKLKGQ